MTKYDAIMRWPWLFPGNLVCKLKPKKKSRKRKTTSAKRSRS
jgi:hypothetical protein